jgi:hypothetical protein
MDLLTKPYPDFYTALEVETGKSIRELENEWLRWACSKFGVDLGKVYGEALAAIKLTVAVTESITKSEKVTATITETKTVIIAAGTVTTISSTTVTTTKTFTEFKTVYQAPTAKTAEEGLSITLIAFMAVVIAGLCLLIALALLLGKRRE